MLGVITAIAVSLLLLGLALVILLAVSGGNWRWGVKVHHAYLIAPDVIGFGVDSCLQQAAVSRLEETNTQVRIKVTHQVALSKAGWIARIKSFAVWKSR